ncbi:Pentatricopeptide repeat [Macleaya cordata]|uniref:Pentatricopeptide repeat n=1 Tax=Macleaya cordata TaxID=56857 RepID=A0A200R4G6_MACCD|nr:Pentatricopeptide repeat [Macleaya cordata]
MEVSSTVLCRSSKFDLQHGFFSNHPKLKLVLVCEPKRNSVGASIPLALALEKEAIGNKIGEEDLNLRDGLSEKFDGEEVGCVITDEVKDTVKFVTEEKEENCKTGSELGDDKSKKVDVRALALNLQFAKTADDVEEVLKDFEELPLNVYSSMIRGFGMDKKMESAMALFEWLKRKRKESDGSIGPNLYIYNSLLGAVKQSEQFSLMEKVMKDMADEGVAPNIVTYNTLMAIHLELRRPNEALNVLEEMQEKGLSPSPVSYSTALLAYRRMEDGNGALKFFVELKEKYQKGEIGKNVDEDWENEFVKLENFITRICYQVMRRWLVKGDHLISDVLKLLKDMDNAGLKPGRTDHEKLVWACTREGHYVVAKELYSRIRERESEISLSVCNHVIWLLGKAKKWWAALEIYEDLLDKGPKPNNLSNELIISHFNVLLTAARKRGIWRWGVRLLNKMEDKGLKPGSREWNAVLVACSKASETSAAVQIFHRMVENGEKPTILSYGALLSALEKGKLYEEAIQVWEHMIKVGIKPNLYAYTIMASVYIGQGKSETVESVMREMVKSGIEPTVVTFNAIISGCARNGMGSTAFEWFHKMKIWNIPPNEITYEMLIEALARDAKPRLAYELYLRAHNEELNLSAKTYDAVVESATNYGATIDVSNLGPRPLEKKKRVKTRKNLSEFCDLADVPRRSKPFDKEELHAPQLQGNQE